MAKVEIKLNREGVRELLRSDEMKAICEERANNALKNLGAGYSVNTFTGKNRVNAEITADTFKAKKENLETNSILKALR